MKNSTARSNSIRYTVDTDLYPGQTVVNPYPAHEQRIKLKWTDMEQSRAKANTKLNNDTLAERFAANCGDILCTINAEGKFINVSAACRDILGYSPEEMEGKYTKDFVYAEDEEVSKAMRQSILSGRQIHSFENRYVSKDGRIIHMAWSGRWSADDHLMYCVGRDDRDKKAVETELQRVNGSLEAKIRERTAQLEHSVKELEAFSYSVSHDLRAPLRIINGYARLLTTQFRKAADEEAQEFLDAIIDSTRHMGALIDDLLNLSRLDREAVNHMDVDMDYACRLALNGMQNEDPSIIKNITIHPLRPAYCDSALIRQVWVNLVSNAVKYSRKKDNPEIEIGSYETDTTVVYYVRDNGAGFDMKFAAKLFGVFVRLHNRSEFEGTGVGLALAHRIVTKHGGKIWANGKVDDGAVFYFSLPKKVEE